MNEALISFWRYRSERRTNSRKKVGALPCGGLQLFALLQ